MPSGTVESTAVYLITVSSGYIILYNFYSYLKIYIFARVRYLLHFSYINCCFLHFFFYILHSFKTIFVVLFFLLIYHSEQDNVHGK